MKQLPLLIVTCLQMSTLTADELGHWPQFRGPSGQGLADAARPPSEFNEAQNLLWKTAIPGLGWSSPVIWNDQLWVTTAAVDQDVVELRAVCLQALTGEILHNLLLFRRPQPEKIHDDNSYASPTPVVDADRVYCHFGTFGTAAIERIRGKIVWKNEALQIEHQGGPGSSPVLFADRLILTCDGANAQFVVALNANDGTEIWKRARSAPFRDDPITRRAFATPLLFESAGQPQLISPAADQLHALNPIDGRELWQIRYLGFSNVPAPVSDAETVYACTGFFEPSLVAINPHGSGDVTQSHVRWFVSRGVTTIPSPIIWQDKLYHLHEGGVLTCYHTADGKVVRKRRFAGNYSASPLLANGQLYLCSEEGKISVVQPNEKLDIVQVNRLLGVIKASPAAVADRLYIRTDQHVYCFQSTE